MRVRGRRTRSRRRRRPRSRRSTTRNRDRVGGRSLAEVHAADRSRRSCQQRAAERARAFTQALRDQAQGADRARAAAHRGADPRRTRGARARRRRRSPSSSSPTTSAPTARARRRWWPRCSARYQGKVRFVHRDFLLGRPRSMAVARAALCAGDQGKFWEYRHDLLHHAGRLERPGPRRRARPAWAWTARLPHLPRLRPPRQGDHRVLRGRAEARGEPARRPSSSTAAA